MDTPVPTAVPVVMSLLFFFIVWGICGFERWGLAIAAVAAFVPAPLLYDGLDSEERCT